MRWSTATGHSARGTRLIAVCLDPPSRIGPAPAAIPDAANLRHYGKRGFPVFWAGGEGFAGRPLLMLADPMIVAMQACPVDDLLRSVAIAGSNRGPFQSAVDNPFSVLGW
jgi:hypothetical protein